jgi:Ca-activated chloride channel family protein
MSMPVTDEFIGREMIFPRFPVNLPVEGINPLSISKQSVEVQIKDQVSKSKIDQTFKNNTRRILEGSFLFPLPSGATISDFALYIEGKRQPGEMLEAIKAKKIYEDIVARKIDPALLEYVGKDLFKARVFPIPAMGERRLDLTFEQVLKLDNGLCRYTLPLRAPKDLTSPIGEFTVTVNLESQRAIKSIYSPSHNIDVSRKDDHHALISFEAENMALDSDFILIYSVDDKSFGCSLLTYRESEDEDGYFMLLLTPRQTMKEEDILPKDVTFVIDTSGSMNGEKMEKAKAALLLCVNSLEERDNFNVIGFSTDTKMLFKELTTASSDNIKKARKFIDKKLRASGGTAINEALMDALSHKPTKDRPYMIVFLTDGKPTIGPSTLEAISENVTSKISKGTRIFTLGVGNTVNTKLLDTLSSKNHGVSEYITPTEDIEIKLSNFYSKIASPVMADIKLDFDTIDITEQYPKEIGDLFKGGQIEIIGRYSNSGDIALKLAGTAGKKRITLAYDAEFPKEEENNEFLERLWAQRKVAYLMDEIRLNGMNSELKDEIIRLGKEYCIQTPYTSFLVLEDGAMDQTLRPLRRSLPMPMINNVMEESRNFSDSEKFMTGNSFGGSSSDSYASSPSARGIGPIMSKSSMNFEADSGESAVSTSRELKKRKDSKIVNKVDSAKVEIVGRRTFYLLKDVWTDSKYKESMESLTIKYGSTAWMNLMTGFEKLKPSLALGENLVIEYKGKALIISATTGEEEKTIASIEAFFATK